MKKIILSLVVAMVFGALSLPVTNLKAAPVQDYTIVSPTVKIQAYKLARNGDIYLASEASATIISPDGLLLTNSHAVLDYLKDPYDAFAVCLSFDENQDPVCEYSAFLKAYDENLDLALLEMSNTDNRGGMLTQVPYLDYHFEGDLTVGLPLDIFGFPDVGGETLTRTRGQLSGFEDRNGVQYFKTDTDISSGNSGGSALDTNGNFIGVPTYILSSVENIGYVLDIKSAAQFIETNLASEPTVDLEAYSVMIAKKNLFNQAKDAKYYSHPFYPNFSVSIPEGWEWESIEQTYISLLSESNEGDKFIEINLLPAPFKITDEHVDELMRIANLFTKYLTNYQQEETTFAGSRDILLTYNQFGEKYYLHYLPYGNSLLMIKYSVKLDKLEKDLPEYNKVLETFAFLEEPVQQPAIIKTLTNSDPLFSVGQVDNWYLLKNQNPSKEDLIAELSNSDALWGTMSISYKEIDDDNKELDSAQSLEQSLLTHQWDSNYKLINKNDSVVVDGLAGWSITYTTNGMEQQKTNKVSEVYLRDGDYVYEFIYEDLIDSYNKNLGSFKKVLNSFKNYNQPEELVGKGEYRLGSLDYAFTDINYHRFEQAITELSEKKVVYGYQGGSFRPEKKITAREAKSFINNSYAESKRQTINKEGSDFLIDDNVTLAKTLQAFIRTYQLDIWLDTYNDAPSWKPYLDKGYEMYLIPEGIVDPDYSLTRAEFTEILNRLLESFEMM